MTWFFLHHASKNETGIVVYRSNHVLHIVLVEDNPADAEMLKAALEQADMPVEVVVLEDGIKAMEYLTGNVSAPHDLVLLDLNLPRINGFEVLERIRANADLKSLPVVVMSGSSDPLEIERCYRAGANSYVCKPTHLNEIFSTIEQLVNYWSKCVKLPSKRWTSRVSRMAAKI
jgi:chemotaxis family two-component system response regulator Rcp1